MYINGNLISTEQELELAIDGMTEISKSAMRSYFSGVKPSPMITQVDLDNARYTKRAAARDHIIAEIASNNLQRLRSGIWTLEQLVSLTQDSEFQAAMRDILSLSFELAMQKINAMTNPLVTSDIKLDVNSKLQANLYL
jgi:hypothetical protein